MRLGFILYVPSVSNSLKNDAPIALCVGIRQEIYDEVDSWIHRENLFQDWNQICGLLPTSIASRCDDESVIHTLRNLRLTSVTCDREMKHLLPEVY